MATHRSLTPEQNHVISSWEVADQAARLAITPLSTDAGKLCWQKSNDSMWVLKNHSPVTWVEVGGAVTPTYTFNNKGSSSGNVIINLADGNMQSFQPTASVTLSITGWPAAGKMGELLLELVNGAAFGITWPSINWIKSDGTTTTNFSNSGVTLQTTGTDFIMLWTRDGGTTVYGKVVR